MKKKLLIVYTSMIVGGATTSLIALLNALDYEKYDVDLLLKDLSGPRQCEIPASVHVLPQDHLIGFPGFLCNLKKAMSVKYGLGVLRAKSLATAGHSLQAIQVRARQSARFSQRHKTQYDVAISFLEFWPLYYVAFYVNAMRKLSWIHIDYLQSDLSINLDLDALERTDAVVLVSQVCLNNFMALCPEYAHKAVCIENLVDMRLARRAASFEAARLPFKPAAGDLTLVSVCRIDFKHKGLDRAVEALARLKNEGLTRGVRWVLIGDGSDMAALRAMIKALDLLDVVFPLGEKMSPLPYVALCDAFFLPSRYEGKPIAVTEAMMLGLPALVTGYASAREQVLDGCDGMVFENSEEGIYRGLKSIVQHRCMLEQMKAFVRNRTWNNREEIASIEGLIDDTDDVWAGRRAQDG